MPLKLAMMTIWIWMIRFNNNMETFEYLKNILQMVYVIKPPLKINMWLCYINCLWNVYIGG
jgi:hypothetical protein